MHKHASHAVAIVAALAVFLTLAPRASAQEFKYEKYKLDNGMTVILHEDHSLPVVAVNTWYKVGAREEPPGRSGFAHLFEHLMFMGTERVPGSDFDVIMETGGGANNASTSLDRTNYFSSGPSSLLPTLLWLDADRLEDLGRTMTTEKLKKQQDVVRNEIRQQVENTPYGKANEYLNQYMYPLGHPYHWNVYGLHEDLEAATAENVKDFFSQFYVPSNASLVVAGDFKSAEIKPLIQSLFGTIAAGAPVQRRQADPVKLDKPIRVTMLDKVQLPMILMAWHSPAQFGEGDVELDLAGTVLSSGKNSRLYKRLVFDEKLATEVSAGQNSAGLGSMFQITVVTTPEADLNKVEKIVDEELAKFAKEGPSASELDERKTAYELSKLRRLGSVLSVADQLNEYEYFFNEPNSFKRDLDRYRNATPAAVRTWAAKVLDLNARGIIRVLPEQPEKSKSGRDQRPADLAQGSFTPTKPEAFKLANGVPVMLWNKPELPLVAVSIQFQPGSPLNEPAKAGLVRLTADMLEEGAGDLDSLAFSSTVQGLGATLGASADQETIDVSMQVLRRNFDKAAALMADMIRKPRLQATDFARVKRLHLEDLKQQNEQPTIVASRVGLRSLFGETNPYGWSMEGTVQTVEPLTLDDIKRAHGTLVHPEFATIFIAGDISAADAKASLDKVLGDWSSGGTAKSVEKRDLTAKAPEKPGMRVILVDRPGAVQTVVRFMAPAPKYADPSRPAYDVLNTMLGGSFTSRLNQNLRERNGFTYGARSTFVQGPNTGYFMASASVKTDTTGAALREFMAEFNRLRASTGGDITDVEVTKARQTLRTEVIQSFEGLQGILGVAGELSRNGRPFEAIAQDLAAVEKTTASEVNAMGRTALALDSGVLVLVGDKKTILAQMKDLKLPEPIELDEAGNPAKK